MKESWFKRAVDWAKIKLIDPSTMQEVPGKLVTILIKKSETHPDKWCLVHDGTKVTLLVPPGGKLWSSANRTMLVGAEWELRDEIARLELDFDEDDDDDFGVADA